MIAITGEAEPDLLADLPGERVGRARMRELAAENMRQLNEPAEQLDGRLLPERGLGARRCSASPTSSGSGAAVLTCIRLDEDDPVAAWREHTAQARTTAPAR